MCNWKISAELEAVVGRLQAKEIQLNEVRRWSDYW